MSYVLRDRSDGQIEFLFFRPILVGLCQTWRDAEQVRTFLKDDQPELPDDFPATFAVATMDASEVITQTEDLIRGAIEAVRKPARRARVPAVVLQRPQWLVQLAPQKLDLTDAERDQALARLAEGEALHLVALDLGTSSPALKAIWLEHRRSLQKFIAQGGQQACAHCQRLFMPSLSYPDTCARCSHV